MIAAWDHLTPEDRDALDRVWRGVDVPDVAASRLIAARLAVFAGREVRLTDLGERVLLARHAALVAERQRRLQLSLSE